MKKKLFYLICFLLLYGFGVFSCQKDLDGIAKQEDTDLIAEAKTFLEQQITVKTRSAKELPLGDFAPLWDKAKVSRSQLMEGVDIPIVSTYSYYTIRKEIIDGRNRSYIANVTEKTVVVKSSKNGTMGLYRMLIIPDYEYFQKNKCDLSDKFTNFGDKENFSGIILYLTVDGKIPLRADTYKGGIKSSEVSLFVTDFETYKRNLAELAKMLPALKIYRQSNIAATRSGWEDPWGNDDDLWSGNAGDDGNWTSIGNGFYYDNNGNIGYDHNGDGRPDGIWLPEVDVTPDGGDSDPPGWNEPALPDPTPPTIPDGSGGGGGGGTTTLVAPKAKKIFRNSYMTDENWKIIEKMLERIMKDCMGKALYNGLLESLRGKTLIIKFDSGDDAGFDVHESAITLSVQYVESNHLFHEMMHAFQAYNETYQSYMASTLNLEIEAHYAQYLYVKELPEFKGNIWEDGYRLDERLLSIAYLDNYIDKKGHLKAKESTEDLADYIDFTVIPIFRKSSEYRSYPYKACEPVSIFSNLNQLTKDC